MLARYVLQLAGSARLLRSWVRLLCRSLVTDAQPVARVPRDRRLAKARRSASLCRSSPSVLYGDRVWPKILAACARKQREGASGDERQRAVGRIDRKHLDLVVDIVQRI
jgi:hypothetical protein